MPVVSSVNGQLATGNYSSVSATNDARNHAPAAADSALCTTESMTCIGAKMIGSRLTRL